ncbi:hypothetical protein ABK040_000976 [Willaertia magna]
MISESLEKELVTFNIGGQVFVTKRSTVYSQGENLLTLLLKEQFPVEKVNGNQIFIDRDPTNFSYILNFLRDGNVPSSLFQNFLQRETLLKEAQFYQIEPLITLLQEEESKRLVKITFIYKNSTERLALPLENVFVTDNYFKESIEEKWLSKYSDNKDIEFTFKGMTWDFKWIELILKDYLQLLVNQRALNCSSFKEENFFNQISFPTDIGQLTACISISKYFKLTTLTKLLNMKLEQECRDLYILDSFSPCVYYPRSPTQDSIDTYLSVGTIVKDAGYHNGWSLVWIYNYNREGGKRQGWVKNSCMKKFLDYYKENGI